MSSRIKLSLSRALPTLEAARTKFKAINGDRLVKDVFRPFLSTRLVNYNGTSLPWPAPTQGVEEPYISVWSKAADGTFRPNEYRYSQDYKEAAIDLAELGFIKEFDKLVQRHDASDLFGLCLYPGDDFEGSCEITVGRANINLKPADVRTPSLNVTLDPNEALQYPSDL
ncbi:conserved hypothetical protein [Microsporum canis CBS 113480]|uniref:Uncharacterized protein n=1 Tax=Arthroderma otae (strain ATCC MYA-4605 / CBS 113480) TaxID=554155 RepID=C5FFN2_ARTOC|nr:conserved hypothetical protein [Microsporum canis CBS 113480]EEQ29479.1 conserved hypothetical protein [Microsporum canis CBS 113480]